MTEIKQNTDAKRYTAPSYNNKTVQTLSPEANG
jgi:hypothetical protein